MLEVGMALRLKGIAGAEAVAEALGVGVADASSALDALVAAGHAQESPRGHRLTPEGRIWLDGLLAAERSGLDGAALEQNYARFCAHNAEFKQLVTDWQVRVVDGEQQLNDHTDAAYDQGIVDRLVELDARVAPVFAEAAALCPRLARYVDKFAVALERVRGGDHTWLAAPMKDSYHTVWFELHEELILVCGRNRADEAAAGRGA